MPDFADFARLRPEVEILCSGEPVSLTNWESDVAVPIVFDRSALPLNLHGLIYTQFGAQKRDLASQ